MEFVVSGTPRTRTFVLRPNKIRNRCTVPATTKLAKIISTPADPYVTALLAKISEGKLEMRFGKGKNIFSQGDRADAIYFIQSGRVKISVVSSSGKEAVLAMLGPHGFFGEGALVGQSLRMSTQRHWNRQRCFTSRSD
jgi:CRP-like cAMP-binding protein